MPTAPGSLERKEERNEQESKRKEEKKGRKSQLPRSEQRTRVPNGKGGFVLWFLTKAKWGALCTALWSLWGQRGDAAPAQNEPQRFLGSLLCSSLWPLLCAAALRTRRRSCGVFFSYFYLFFFNLFFFLELSLCFQCCFRTCQPQPRVGGAGNQRRFGLGSGWGGGAGTGPRISRRKRIACSREQQGGNAASASSAPLVVGGCGGRQEEPWAALHSVFVSSFMAQAGARPAALAMAVQIHLSHLKCICAVFSFFFSIFFFLFFFPSLSLSLITQLPFLHSFPGNKTLSFFSFSFFQVKKNQRLKTERNPAPLSPSLPSLLCTLQDAQGLTLSQSAYSLKQVLWAGGRRETSCPFGGRLSHTPQLWGAEEPPLGELCTKRCRRNAKQEWSDFGMEAAAEASLRPSYNALGNHHESR